MFSSSERHLTMAQGIQRYMEKHFEIEWILSFREMFPQNTFTLTFSKRGININTMKLLIIVSQGCELAIYSELIHEVNSIILQIFDCKNKFIILMFAQVALNYNI